MTFFRFLHANRLFLLAGVLLSFTSSYGQTFFIALFSGQIMEDFGLSDGQWGLTYTIATTVSAIVMVWAGVLTDQFRIRNLSVVVSLGLALSCLAMAVVQPIWALGIVVFALRLFGQGMMSHLCVVSMARWFVATRGRALSVAAMGFAFGQAALPVIFVSLQKVWDWRLLWVLAAVLVLIATPLIFRLLKSERTPQSVSESTSSTGMNGRQWTRGDLLRHWLFWVLIPLMLGPAAWGTSLFFHQVHLTGIKGWDMVDFVALLPLFTVASIAATFGTGALIDRFGTSRLMQLYLVPFIISFFVMAGAETLWGAALAMMLLGIGTGSQATIPVAFWAEYYGTRHLGAIRALSGAVMVFGSAIGPGITAALIDRGIDFPDQMWAMSAYFAFSAAISTIAIAKARQTLTVAPEIDIIRA